MNYLNLYYADFMIRELAEIYPKGKSVSLRDDEISRQEKERVYAFLKSKYIIERKGVRTYLTDFGFEILNRYGSFTAYYSN